MGECEHGSHPEQGVGNRIGDSESLVERSSGRLEAFGLEITEAELEEPLGDEAFQFGLTRSIEALSDGGDGPVAMPHHPAAAPESDVASSTATPVAESPRFVEDAFEGFDGVAEVAESGTQTSQVASEASLDVSRTGAIVPFQPLFKASGSGLVVPDSGIRDAFEIEVATGFDRRALQRVVSFEDATRELSGPSMLPLAERDEGATVSFEGSRGRANDRVVDRLARIGRRRLVEESARGVDRPSTQLEQGSSQPRLGFGARIGESLGRLEPARQRVFGLLEATQSDESEAPGPSSSISLGGRIAQL
jgi:hypothetical protein